MGQPLNGTTTHFWLQQQPLKVCSRQNPMVFHETRKSRVSASFRVNRGMNFNIFADHFQVFLFALWEITWHGKVEKMVKESSCSINMGKMIDKDPHSTWTLTCRKPLPGSSSWGSSVRSSLRIARLQNPWRSCRANGLQRENDFTLTGNLDSKRK